MIAPYKIIDCAVDVTNHLRAIKDAGIVGIIRYDYRANGWKQLQLDEANAILNAGFELGIVYEGPGDKVGTFSNNTGVLDATYSLKRAVERGQPQQSAIYFAVDFDASLAEIRSNIIPYFKGVQSVLRTSGYRVGVYSSGFVAQSLKDAHLVDLTWVSCSRGWNGSKEYIASGLQDLWQIQCEKVLVAGLEKIDFNVSTTDDWGQWSASGLPIIGQPKSPSVPVSPPKIAYDEKWLQTKLNEHGANPALATDGKVGNKTIQAMINYFLKLEHPNEP